MSNNPILEAIHAIKCLRCGQKLVEDKAIGAASVVGLEMPNVEFQRSFSLCGACTPELLAFLFPALENGEDPYGGVLLADVRDAVKQVKARD